MYRNFHATLHSEMFDSGCASPGPVVPSSPIKPAPAPAAAAAAATGQEVPSMENALGPPQSPARRLFQYQSPLRTRPAPMDHPDSPRYLSSPLKPQTQQLLSSPRPPLRTIPKTPMKVLDAPDLQVRYAGRSNRATVRAGAHT